MSTSHRYPGKHGVAAALRDRRESLGLSRKEIADRSGLSYPYVSQLENGDREPSLDALSKLAAALGIAVDELLKPAGRPLTSPAPAAAPLARTGHAPLEAERPEAGLPAAAAWDKGDRAAEGRAATRKWLRNPAYSSAQTAAAPPASRSETAAAVDKAYTLLLALPPAQRLDAVGALLARCLRDSAGQA